MELRSKLILAAALTVAAACSEAPKAVNEGPWAVADKIVEEMTKVSFPDRSVSILDYGAVANDANVLCHEAINLAILDMNQQGGGTVVVPKGTFLTGPITLKSNVNLHLEEGATLLFSNDNSLYFPPVETRWEGLDCYNTHPLIYAWGETNIALTGKGVIDSQYTEEELRLHQRTHERSDFDGHRASRLLLLELAESQTPIHQRIFDEEIHLRQQTINFNRCTTVLIEDVTLLHSPFWVIHPVMCNDLTLRGVTIENNSPNGDGCDPESCHNVLIENCVFNTGDDCIAIKSGRNEDGRKWHTPSENIVVRGCYMKNGHAGVAIGSEISGGYRNLFVENCNMDSPVLDRVIRIKTSTARGGDIDGIYVRNVTVGQCREAVLKINLKYEPNEVAKRGFIPSVRNVLLENVTSEGSNYGIYLIGLDDEKQIENVKLVNCAFNSVADGNRTDGLVDQVVFENCTINGQQI